MTRFALEAQLFAAAQAARERDAKQLVAVSLGCGIDLPSALRARGAARLQTIRRVRRVLERERLRGASGHPDYCLERHIALGESLAKLQTDESAIETAPVGAVQVKSTMSATPAHSWALQRKGISRCRA